MALFKFIKERIPFTLISSLIGLVISFVISNGSINSSNIVQIIVVVLFGIIIDIIKFQNEITKLLEEIKEFQKTIISNFNIFQIGLNQNTSLIEYFPEEVQIILKYNSK